MNQVDWKKVVYCQEENKLLLTDQNFTEIPSTIVDLYCNHVQYLDLSFNSINNLDCLQLFKNVNTIILDNNNIKDEVFLRYNIDGGILYKVKMLSLNKNEIRNLSLILFIIARIFPNLEYLSLLGNPACPDNLTLNKSNYLAYESYKDQIIQTLSHLKFLDYMKISASPDVALVDENKFKSKILKYKNTSQIIIAKLKNVCSIVIQEGL